MQCEKYCKAALAPLLLPSLLLLASYKTNWVVAVCCRCTGSRSCNSNSSVASQLSSWRWILAQCRRKQLQAIWMSVKMRSTWPNYDSGRAEWAAKASLLKQTATKVALNVLITKCYGSNNSISNCLPLPLPLLTSASAFLFAFCFVQRLCGKRTSLCALFSLFCLVVPLGWL